MKGLVLRKLKEEDAENMLEWMFDGDICKNFRFDGKQKGLEDALTFIRSAENIVKAGNSIHYAITQDGGEYLGTASLKNLDMVARHAEFAIVLRKKAQGKGLALAATKEMLRLAFSEFGLQRVYLNVLRENEKAIRLYERCGFVYEGEFRKHLFLGGEFKMLRWYGLLKEEYEKMRGGAERTSFFLIQERKVA